MFGSLRLMGNDRPVEVNQGIHAVRHELLEADNRKLKRILALMDNVSDPAVNQALLDPLRPRLAILRPVRPLRFGRLLLTPLDPLIVPARTWKPGAAAVPRTALGAIFKTVRAELGTEVTSIDRIIERYKFDAPMALTLAGEALWPRAAEILAVAGRPVDWAETGLRPEVWPNLAKAVAAVLARAPQLRGLVQDARMGAVEWDNGALTDILRHSVGEPPEAYAMIIRLILLQAPHVTPMLRKIASSSRSPVDKIMMRQAIEQEMDHALTDMEASVGFADEIGCAGLADATAGVSRMATLLREVELDTDAAVQRPRLKAIREKLNLACQARFATGVSEGLVAPMSAASAPVNGAAQTALESCARDLRRMEIVARKVGDPASYDRQLQRASEAARVAAGSGILTEMRHLRLTEILLSSDAAERLYDSGRASVSAG
jgi:hypothetical protein